MIYELRVYQATPGKMGALNERFANHTVHFFEKYGIKVVGYWTDVVGNNHELTYICAFDSLEDMGKKWAAFQADSEWLKVRADSEKDGPLVAQVRNKIMRPTPYSALQ